MSNSYSIRKYLAFVIVPALFNYSCGEHKTPEQDKLNNSQPPRPAHHKVEIKQMMFVPADLIVRSGDTVTFINLDMVEHDITEQKEKKWASAKLKTDMKFTRVFNETTGYFCSIHPVMTGRIIIE